MVERFKTDPQSMGDIFRAKKAEEKKPPAYSWQELALQIIRELSIPGMKKSSVFKVCRDNPKDVVLRCLNDTKELCTDGERWRYFMKVITNKEPRK